MSQERERALGQAVGLRKQIYELAVKAQSMANDIYEESNSFLSDKDFSSMDFKKIETLAIELQKLQKDYAEKSERLQSLIKTYDFREL